MIRFFKDLGTLFIARRYRKSSPVADLSSIGSENWPYLDYPALTAYLKELSLDLRQWLLDYFKQVIDPAEGNVNRQVELTIEVISDLIDTSFQGRDILYLKEIRFSVRTLIETVFQLYKFKEQNEPFEIQLDFSPEFPQTVNGNPYQLVRIIILLLESAFSHTAEGFISMTCFFQNQMLILNISESGASIPDVEKDVILFPERKGNSVLVETIQRKGLLIAGVMIREAGGQLLIKSEHRLGNIFTAQFPLQEATDKPSELPDIKMITSQVAQAIAEKPEFGPMIFNSLSCLQDELVNLKLAIESNQNQEVRRILHGMKGFPAGFGLTGIYDRIKRLENQIKLPESDASRMKLAINELKDLIKDTEDFLNAELEDFPLQTNDQILAKPGSSSLKVLVAEDNRMNQDMIGYILNVMKFDYKMVENGTEVMEALESEHFDLLLLDMKMPVMDGVETIRKLRSESRWVHLPVIAVTAQNMEGDAIRYKNAGCDEFVAKPIDINELKEKIHKLLF